MLTFQIENLYTKATGPGHEMHILRNILSCYVPGYSFTKAYKEGRWNGKKYFLTKKGFLPTGLLPYAIKKLPPWIQINKIDQRNIPQFTCRETVCPPDYPETLSDRSHFHCLLEKEGSNPGPCR
ncbi:hypothetical protein DMNBHIDG_01201 [Candidatus Methanoperedenaceae archaeon GB37]|nr:hypothetical protein DMNBHIDG_01201 [Candidatus Methanoperedenaceae archaeon GB37]